MRTLGKWLGRVLLLALIAVGALWALGPYEPAPLTTDFDAETIGPDPAAYLARREARFDDITEGTEKRILWSGNEGTMAPWSVVYVHGFSATSQEIRPVPDRVAQALDANLVFTRLRGHGRSNDAMGEATVAAWMTDVAEALAVARRVGDRVLIVSTSTGGTLVAAAAQDPVLMQNVAGAVFLSPNFGVNNPAAPLLTWPAARYWLPLLVGERRSFEPRGEAQATYWTTEYPSTATLPMAGLVRAVVQSDLAAVTLPALFMLSPDDQVVRADATEEVIARWAGPVARWTPSLTPRDDPYAHVIAGDIMSPDQTAPATQAILDWVQGL